MMHQAKHTQPLIRTLLLQHSSAGAILLAEIALQHCFPHQGKTPDLTALFVNFTAKAPSSPAWPPSSLHIVLAFGNHCNGSVMHQPSLLEYGWVAGSRDNGCQGREVRTIRIIC